MSRSGSRTRATTTRTSSSRSAGRSWSGCAARSPERRSTVCTPCARLRRSSEMFDLRYHVASLAAVFLALVIGILVGVGISDRGLVDSANRSLLKQRVARLQSELDAASKSSALSQREQRAAQVYMSETYPVLVRNRLRGKRIAVLFAGSVDGGVRSTIDRALTDSGAVEE